MKMTKAIAVLGVVAGLGVAAMPLSSFAQTATGDINVSAVVDSTIGMKISNTDVMVGTVTKDMGAATSAATDVTVSSNGTSGYKLYISGETDMVRLVNDTPDGIAKNKIPALAADKDIMNDNVTAWAYRVNGTGAWKGVKSTYTVDADKIDETAASGTHTTSLNFAVRVAAAMKDNPSNPGEMIADEDNDLDAGTYRATVTLTAIENQ